MKQNRFMEIADIYQLFLQCPRITTDSRNCSQNSIFIALRGENFDGNAFARSALDNGSAYAIVDNPDYYDASDRRMLLVDDCLDTLQRLANFHRRTLGIKILAITGTNGKTTTKELIATVLSEVHNVLYTQGNLNNHIGVPLTLLQMTNRHNLAVIEMGASHPGEISKLSDIVEPNFGLITNIGKAHLEGFGSFEGVKHTKGELFDYLRTKEDGTAFVNNENKCIDEMADGLLKIKYGTTDGLYVNGEIISSDPFLSFRWKAGKNGEYTEVKTKLIGAYNFENAMAAVAVGRFFGVDARHIKRALEGYSPSNNRSQFRRTRANSLIIDAYNANPTSMSAAIANFKKIKGENKTLILGDMRELGVESASEHQKVIDMLVEYGFDDVWLVGTQFAATDNKFKCFPNVVALADYLKENPIADRTILIKGSNAVHLEKIIDLL